MNDVLTPKFIKRTLTHNQSAKDIVKGIGIAVTDSRQAALIVKNKFADKDPIKSCEKLWKYLKDPSNLEYVKETAKGQTVKSIQRIIYDKLGDCKHYAIFSQSILTALGIPCFLRLVSQKANDKEPTHIYTVALIKGTEYVVDPCMSYFDEECNYNYKCDLIQKNMSLKYLAGADDVEIGRAKHKIKGAIGKKEAQIKKNFVHAKQQYEKEVKKAGGEIKKVSKRIAVINKNVAVKSFLRYISINGGGFATRLKESYRNDPQGLKDFWSKFGKWDDLRDAINKGSKQGAKISGMGDDADTGDSSGGGGSSQSSQYEAGAKESVGIIKQLIAWWQARKAKKKGDDAIAQKMEDAVNNDPTIPKVDENGNPAPATLVENAKPVVADASGNIQNIEQASGGASNVPAVTNTTDTGSGTPTNGSFGLSEINSFATLLHWLRGAMGIVFGFSIIGFPILGNIICISSFVYLIRKYFLNVITKGISTGEAKRSAIQ